MSVSAFIGLSAYNHSTDRVSTKCVETSLYVSAWPFLNSRCGFFRANKRFRKKRNTATHAISQVAVRPFSGFAKDPTVAR
jgi:hypothetical protein